MERKVEKMTKPERFFMRFLLFEWAAFNALLLFVLWVTATQFDATEITAIALTVVFSGVGAVSSFFVARAEINRLLGRP